MAGLYHEQHALRMNPTLVTDVAAQSDIRDLIKDGREDRFWLRRKAPWDRGRIFGEESRAELRAQVKEEISSQARERYDKLPPLQKYFASFDGKSLDDSISWGMLGWNLSHRPTVSELVYTGEETLPRVIDRLMESHREDPLRILQLNATTPDVLIEMDRRYRLQRQYSRSQLRLYGVTPVDSRKEHEKLITSPIITFIEDDTSRPWAIEGIKYDVIFTAEGTAEGNHVLHSLKGIYGQLNDGGVAYIHLGSLPQGISERSVVGLEKMQEWWRAQGYDIQVVTRQSRWSKRLFIEGDVHTYTPDDPVPEDQVEGLEHVLRDTAEIKDIIVRKTSHRHLRIPGRYSPFGNIVFDEEKAERWATEAA